MAMHKVLIGWMLALAPGAALAGGHAGSISFSAEEVSLHLSSQDRIEEVAADCLAQDLRRHREFYARYKISPFFGDRSVFGKMKDGQRKQVLRNRGLDPKLLNEMEPTSCVGLVLKCLGRGFEAAGQKPIWQRIRAYTLLNGADGTSMQKALQLLGWKVLYWNPDVSRNRGWDEIEKAKDPTNKTRIRGFHEENWRTASTKRKYLYNDVDDAAVLVNFGDQVPELLRRVPFFVGTAHGGYHVFPGSFGKVTESHSTRSIGDPRSLESEDFNPIAGLAPTEGTYKSGMIAIPAKYFR